MNKFKNPITKTIAVENETNGMHNEEIVFCPAHAYGYCPYCDQCNICHIQDPIEECDNFGAYFESWEEWENRV